MTDLACACGAQLTRPATGRPPRRCATCRKARNASARKADRAAERGSRLVPLRETIYVVEASRAVADLLGIEFSGSVLFGAESPEAVEEIEDAAARMALLSPFSAPPALRHPETEPEDPQEAALNAACRLRPAALPLPVLPDVHPVSKRLPRIERWTDPTTPEALARDLLRAYRAGVLGSESEPVDETPPSRRTE